VLAVLDVVRDESSKDAPVRLVFEPKTSKIEQQELITALLAHTSLETSSSINLTMVGLDGKPVQKSLRQILVEWISFRQTTITRRSQHRLAKVLDRIHMEHKKLSAEQRKLQALMKSEAARWEAIGAEIEAMRARFGDGALGARRTATGAAVPVVVVDDAAFVEREAITVILSEKGWIRAQKGHVSLEGDLRFKEGDSLLIALHAETTDRLVLFATNGKAFTLKADTIPRGRGDGQPVRLLLDLTNEDTIVTMFLHREGLRYLVAASDGKGFLVKAEDLLAEKRTGKQVLNVDPPAEAAICVPAEGDSIAVIGENRKLLVFPLDEAPRMARGKGVRMQRYKDGGVADAKVFVLKEGLAWTDASGRVFTVSKAELAEWIGHRAEAGRLPPRGFPRSNRFGA